jgi:outer membrane lipoprotein-sorting protein
VKEILKCGWGIAFCLAMIHVSTAQAQDASAILKQVDAFRNPLESFALDVQLTSFRNTQSETSAFRVYGQGSDKSLVEFRSPAAEQGKYLLMLRDAMWMYMPSTSRPIRISPLQRLMGEASNGDVARTNFTVDYVPELAGEEEVEGRSTYVLDLKARDPDLSYSRVKLWVAKRNYQPIKADFYVVSGKLMKRAFYRDFGMMNGSRVVTKIEIQDVVRPGHRTVMQYSDLQVKKLPEKMFNKNYLGKW